MEKEAELFFSTLIQLGKILMQQSQISIEERTSTHLQFLVLSYIKSNKNSKMSEIAKDLTLSDSSATQVVERLVKAGFLSRVSDHNDRRITHITITSTGEKEYTRIKSKIVEEIEKVFMKIPEEDRKELIRIHSNLLDTLKNDRIE